MALRLRRGTDADRLLITPVEGELIYTTDTKLLYVGDGATVGGTLVTGAGGGGSATLDGLTDTDVSGATDNQVLTWIAGNNKWEPTTIPGVGALGLNDLSDVNMPNPPLFNSVLRFDGINFVPTNVESLIANVEGNLKINVAGNDSTIMVDGDTGTLNGDLFGNVTGNVTGNLEGNVTGNVNAADGTNVLYSGTDGTDASYVGEVTGNVIGNITSTGTSSFSGSVDFAGAQVTNLQGNAVIGGDLRIGGATQNSISTIDPATTTLLISTTNTSGEIVMGKPLRIGGASSGFDNYGFLNIFNEIQNTNALTITHSSESANSVTATIAKSRGTKISPTVVTSGDTLGAFQAQGYNGAAYRNAGGMAVIANGTPGAAFIPAKVSLYTAASNGIPTPQFTVDGNGTGTFAGAAQLAVYADNTARDAAITSPTAGMLVFNTTNTKFQGYTGSAWVDLN